MTLSERMAERGAGYVESKPLLHLYHSYFESLVMDALPSILYRVLGKHAAFRFIAESTRKAAMEALKRVNRYLGVTGSLTLNETLSLQTQGYRNHSTSRSIGMVVQSFDKMVDKGDEFILETENCAYAELAARCPVTCAACVGLMAGILSSMGHNAYPIMHGSELRILCRSLAARNIDYVVYRDDVQLPRCRIIVKRIKC